MFMSIYSCKTGGVHIRVRAFALIPSSSIDSYLAFSQANVAQDLVVLNIVLTSHNTGSKRQSDEERVAVLLLSECM